MRMSGVRWREARVCLITLVLAIICPVSGDHDEIHIFVSGPGQVNVGDTVTLACSVQNHGSKSVSWWYVDHGVQISKDSTKVSPESKYDIIHPQGADGEWDLQISKVSAQDAGHYACEIDGTTEGMTFLLTVQNVTKIIPTVDPNANFTDCCTVKQVSSTCKPLCAPNSLTLEQSQHFEQNPSMCAADLLKLLACGADGRNHAPCCRRALVADRCLGFCVNNPPASLGSKYQVCLDQAQKITDCMLEGQVTLPSPPTSVSAQESATEIVVLWQAPKENANLVIGYRVFTKAPTQDVFIASPVVAGMSYILTRLMPVREYSFYVVAISEHGSSLPSVMLKAITLDSNPIDPSPTEQRLTDCCRKRKVSEKCNTLLCTAAPRMADDSDIFSCFPELNTVFTCIAGERNHTNCCIRDRVPEMCYKLCAGTMDTDYSALTCVTSYMQDINKCFMEGMKTLPSPPSNMRIDTVEDDSALIKWDAPLENAEKVAAYEVLYKEDYQTQYMKVNTTDTEYLLMGLKASTRYDVEVLSVSKEGSSLPTPEAVFLTYYEGLRVQPFTTPLTPTLTPPPPYTVTQCCINENVPEECHEMCSYETDFQGMDYNTLLLCELHIGTALMCGANGRNHTDCCIQRGVNNVCLQFCAFSKEEAKNFQFSLDHIACVQEISDVVQCMKVGLNVVPGSPEKVRLVDIAAQSLSIQWNKPKHIPTTGITRYDIYYKVDSDLIWQLKTISDPEQNHYILQNLVPDTIYDIKLLSVNLNGTSLPSPTISPRTLPLAKVPPPLLPGFNFTTPDDLTVCCRSQGVSQECMPGCTGSTAISTLDCSSQLKKLFICAADGRNHRQCCSRDGVPPECLPFCDGNAAPPSITSFLCLPFTEIIIGCFHEGYDNLPSPPSVLRVEDLTSRSLKFSFEKPAKNGDNVMFDFFWRANDMSQFQAQAFKVIEDVKSPVMINDLEPMTLYEVFMISKNKNGTSQPTPTIKVRTLSENRPTVDVRQQPASTYIQVGQTVSLICLAGGEPFPQIYWLDRNNKRTNTTQLNINRTRAEDSGRYTCVANNGLGPQGITSKSLYLKVQSPPIARAKESLILVEPRKGLSVLLVCFFQGYPEPNRIKWLKGDQVLSSDNTGDHYKIWSRDDESNAVMEAVLEINSVSDIAPNDYGTYVCQGENNHGMDKANIVLAHSRDYPDITQPPVIPNVPNVTACCIQKGVSAMCMPACTFDIDLSLVTRLPNPLACTNDLSHFVQCAADGRNHTMCCKSKGLPDICLGFCSGVIPDLHIGLIECISRVEEIISCMEEGHDNLPSTPQNLQGKLNAMGYVQLNWDPPKKNPELVQEYVVNYHSQSSGNNRRTVDAPATSRLIDGIHGNTRYTFNVVAQNHHGESQPSNSISIVTHDLKPSEPLNLRGKVVASVYIRLDWDPPKENPGYVTKYRIFYRPGQSKTFLNVTTPDAIPSYRLDNLDPLTKYEIYVSTISSSSEGGQSNIIILETELPTETKKQSHSSPVTTALGVFFTVLVVLVVASIVAFYYLRIRKSGPLFKESVSFENPGYATASEARVSGLPTYTDDGNMQPSNGHLGTKAPSIMKEEDSDQGYATLSETTNGHLHSEKTTNQATLDVIQTDSISKNDVTLSFENSDKGASNI